MSSIKMVCFDVGGVLVKHHRSWDSGCAAAGLPVRDGAMSPDMAAHRREVTAAYTTGRIDDGRFYGEMSRLMKGLYTPEEVRRVHHQWLGPEYDGVAAVIHRLISISTIDTGVLSNTNSSHWARMTRTEGRATEFPTPAMLRHRHASHLLGFAKPDPRAFREFERRTDYRGAEILYFEDLPENAEVARAQGWIVELIDHTGDTASQLEAALAKHRIL
jgi:FMN phosphatase YigB (HAD superfamily)